MIRVEHLSLTLGAFSLRDISFEVPSGEHAALMGRTGCGKTTILEAVCGLRPVDDGRVELMGRDVTRRKPAERGIGYVPQDGALFTTLTVRQHLSFARDVRRMPRPGTRAKVEQLASLLGIRHLLDRRPRGLSGGEQQRVALGRALSCEPGILCLDEPLSALDDETTGDMIALLRSIRRATEVTILHVTHDRHVALALATRILRLTDDGGLRREDPDVLRRREREESARSPQASDRAGGEPGGDRATSGPATCWDDSRGWRACE